MNDASSEAKKVKALAMSSARPTRLIGYWVRVRLKKSSACCWDNPALVRRGVWVRPGLN